MPFFFWLRDLFGRGNRTGSRHESRRLPFRRNRLRLAVELLELRDCPSAVWTDKPDYHPGSDALFSGDRAGARFCRAATPVTKNGLWLASMSAFPVAMNNLELDRFAGQKAVAYGNAPTDAGPSGCAFG